MFGIVRDEGGIGSTTTTKTAKLPAEPHKSRNDVCVCVYSGADDLVFEITSPGGNAMCCLYTKRGGLERLVATTNECLAANLRYGKEEVEEGKQGDRQSGLAMRNWQI